MVVNSKVTSISVQKSAQGKTTAAAIAPHQSWNVGSSVFFLFGL
jgi:hypothetical protein